MCSLLIAIRFVPSLIKIAEMDASPAVQKFGFRRRCVGGRSARKLTITALEEYERSATGEGMFVHGLDPADEDLVVTAVVARIARAFEHHGGIGEHRHATGRGKHGNVFPFVAAG